MLQLTVVSPGQAHAAATLPEHAMSGVDAGNCPAHRPNDLTIEKGGGSGPLSSAPSSHDNPAQEHDCCRSLGCQCHSAQTPGALNLPPTRVALSASELLPAFDARPAVTRMNEFFRPPIA
jgi:hypothetical protein